jgi:hypothetical protein
VPFDLAACVHRCVHRHLKSAHLQAASDPAGGISRASISAERADPRRHIKRS